MFYLGNLLKGIDNSLGAWYKSYSTLDNKFC